MEFVRERTGVGEELKSYEKWQGMSLTKIKWNQLMKEAAEVCWDLQ